MLLVFSDFMVCARGMKMLEVIATAILSTDKTRLIIMQLQAVGKYKGTLIAAVSGNK